MLHYITIVHTCRPILLWRLLRFAFPKALGFIFFWFISRCFRDPLLRPLGLKFESGRVCTSSSSNLWWVKFNAHSLASTSRSRATVRNDVLLLAKSGQRAWKEYTASFWGVQTHGHEDGHHAVHLNFLTCNHWSRRRLTTLLQWSDFRGSVHVMWRQRKKDFVKS